MKSSWLIATFLFFATARATSIAADRQIGSLAPGKFFWEPELAPTGPLVVIISLPDQTLSAYRNGVRIAYSSISSGVRGRCTPAGVFTILEKEVTHFSNRYHHAPMPFMQRLTWEGVALHGGDLPGYPASHGCIRLPRDFARKLYSLTVRGTTVIVVDEKHPQPTIATHTGILLAAADSEPDLSGPNEFEWNPEQSAEGPITILASGADETVYVYRNGIPIGRAAFKIDNPHRPLGGHAFTMLEGVTERPSAFVPGRPAHRWMAVRTEGKTTLEDIARRVRISPAFAEKVYDIVSPGTTIVVTDAPALRPSPSAHAVFLMEAAKQQHAKPRKHCARIAQLFAKSVKRSSLTSCWIQSRRAQDMKVQDVMTYDVQSCRPQTNRTKKLRAFSKRCRVWKL